MSERTIEFRLDIPAAAHRPPNPHLHYCPECAVRDGYSTPGLRGTYWCESPTCQGKKRQRVCPVHSGK